MADPQAQVTTQGLEMENEALDLVVEMVAYAPGDRITMEGIRSHPWMKKETASQEQVKGFY